MNKRGSFGWLVALKRAEAPLALLFGMFFALSLHAYLLIDYFPLTGKRLPVLTLLAFLTGSAGFFFLFGWVQARLHSISRKKMVMMVFISLLLSVFLFFATTPFWLENDRYPALLLPENRLKIEAISAQPGLTLEWLSTPFGDISYQSARFHGWERQGDVLTLTDPQENTIEWRGKTGGRIQIAFQRPRAEATLHLTINGSMEEIKLAPDGASQASILRALPVPFYASAAVSQTSLLLTAAALLFAFLVLNASRIEAAADQIQRSIAQFPRSGGEGRPRNWEWGILLAVIAAAVLLRIFQLDQLSPYTDEYLHMIAAKRLLGGASLSAVYQRSLFTVTLPVWLSFKLFGLSVWSARLPGVIINALTIWPLYLVMRKINRPTALLAILLYATSPWIIGVSRTTREYASYPFLFFWILYAMLLVMEGLPHWIILDRSFLKQIQARWLVPLALLLLPLVYGWKVDAFSTFKVIFLAYGVFALFLLARFDLKARANRLPLALLICVCAIGAWAILTRWHYFSGRHEILLQPLELFFPNPQQQWYYNRLNLVAILAIFCAAALAVRLYRRNPVPLFFGCMLLAFLIFFLFLFSPYFRARYVSYAQLWYLALLAFGLYSLWKLTGAFLPRKAVQAGLAGLLLVVSYNPGQTLFPSTYSLDGTMPVTVEYHYNVEAVDSYLRQNAKPPDIMVGTIYYLYEQFAGTVRLQKMRSYNFDALSANDDLAKLVAQYPSGWIVVDRNRHVASRQPLPKSTFVMGNRRIEFVGEFGDEYLWHWE